MAIETIRKAIEYPFNSYALEATRKINPKLMISIHWGTLRSRTKKIEDPKIALKEAL